MRELRDHKLEKIFTARKRVLEEQMKDAGNSLNLSGSFLKRLSKVLLQRTEYNVKIKT